MSERFRPSSVFAGQEVRIRAGTKSRQLPKLIHRRANSLFGHRIVIYRRMQGRLCDEPWRRKVPILGEVLANRRQIVNVVFSRTVFEYVGLALLPKHGSKSTDGLSYIAQTHVKHLARPPLPRSGAAGSNIDKCD